jgi:hypothetical protein
MNEVAEDGQVFVCLACGKRSQDTHGEQKISQDWDESCMLNCQKFPVDRLVIKNGLVMEVKEGP